MVLGELRQHVDPQTQVSSKVEGGSGLHPPPRPPTITTPDPLLESDSAEVIDKVVFGKV